MSAFFPPNVVIPVRKIFGGGGLTASGPGPGGGGGFKPKMLRSEIPS